MKVLIVKTSSMGDLIHTLPAVTDAKNSFPNIQFDWVAEESFAEIPSWHPGIHHVIPIAFRRWRKHIFKSLQGGDICTTLKQIRSTKYDYVIDAQGLIKSALVTWFSLGLRCGMDLRSSRESLASLAYQYKYPVPRDKHAIERIRLLFSQSLGYQFNKKNIDYGLDKRIFPIQSLTSPYIVFLHGTSRPRKLWQDDQWIELAKIVRSQGFQVYMTWGNDQEKGRAQKIADSAEGCHVLSNMNLSKVAGMLSQATAVVAVDTGLAHLTAALSVPAVTIYMDTSPELTGTCGLGQVCLTQKERGQKSQDTAGLRILTSRSITAAMVWEQLRVVMG